MTLRRRDDPFGGQGDARRAGAALEADPASWLLDAAIAGYIWGTGESVANRVCATVAGAREDFRGVEQPCPVTENPHVVPGALVKADRPR